MQQTFKQLAQRKVARVGFDEGHCESWSISPDAAKIMQPAHPADSSYARAAQALAERDFEVARVTDPLLSDTLRAVDLLVIAHPSDSKWEHTTGLGSPRFSADELAAIQAWVRAGGGLLVLAETEQEKYGNNVNELLSAFGIHADNATLTDHTRCDRDVPSWVFADFAGVDRSQNVLEGVRQACFLRAGALSLAPTPDASVQAQVVLRASPNANPASAGLIATACVGAGRVAVLADSDLFGDDDLDHFDHRQLWLNLVYWCAAPAFGRSPAQPASGASSIAQSPAWLQLKQAVNTLRGLQAPDGALRPEADRPLAQSLVAAIDQSIGALTPAFPHQTAYLTEARANLTAWARDGFLRPDFGGALTQFRPELHRRDQIEHLAFFPLYTPNGSPETRFEALLTRTPWPDWLAALECERFDNGKFVPVHLIDHTDGYASECAVLFPETVALTGKPSNNFGGIFCDREAARYQRVVLAACAAMRVNLPPQAAAFLRSADLVRDAFVLWDLIHDRWHSHGELPFDPFMIRQRLPYWMYSLEELRVDLQTFGSAIELERDGFPFARYVRYGILFDRIFRFPITGSRVRNYDGLGGQLLFAYLHKNGIAVWRDNALSIDWERLDEGVAGLRESIEALYRDGIDMSKVQYWLAAHELVSGWVKPNLGSKWAKETRVLSDESQPKEWVNRVLDDEFPLSLFYLQLQKKLAA